MCNYILESILEYWPFLLKNTLNICIFKFTTSLHKLIGCKWRMWNSRGNVSLKYIFGRASSSSKVFDRWILLASDRKLCVGLSPAPEVTARRHTDHATISRFLDCVLFHVPKVESLYLGACICFSHRKWQWQSRRYKIEFRNMQLSEIASIAQN